MVSEWMVNGNIKEFAKAGVNTDRLGFVCFPSGSFFPPVANDVMTAIA